MTPAKSSKLAKKNGVKLVDLKFIDFLGIWQHTTIPIAQLDDGTFEDGYRLRRLVDPRLAADQRVRHADHPGPDDGGDRSVPARTPTLSLICDIVDPITKQPYTRDPRNIAAQGRGVPQVDRHRRHVVLRPRGRVLHLRRRPLLRGPEPRLLLRRLRRRRAGTAAARRARTSATSRATREATSRCRRPTRCTTCAPRWSLTMRGGRHRGRGRPPRGRDRRSVRDRHAASTALTTMADQLMWYKYVVKNVARKHGKTATFMPKPLFGDNGSGMHCHQSLWKDEQAALRRRRLRRAVARWRSTTSAASSSTRRRSCAFTNPTHEQLQPAGAGLRGAGEPGVLEPQPLGVDPHPDVLAARRRRKRIEVRLPGPERATRTSRSRRC